MRGYPDATLDELSATIAVARLVLGPKMHLQAPPNLVDGEFARMLRAGIDDWGGVSPVTADHVNPERPWPQIDVLAEHCHREGFELRERLTVYPRYVHDEEAWIDPRVAPFVQALAGPDGRASAATKPQGQSWQEPDAAQTSGRDDLHVTIDTEGRRQDQRGDAGSVYGDWVAIGEQVSEDARRRGSALGAIPGQRQSIRPEVSSALLAAANDPAALTDEQALTLFEAMPGAEIDALAQVADDVRRDTVGETVTYVVNRNINFTNVCYTGCRFCAFAQRRTDADAYSLSLAEVGERAAQAWDAGATEVCMQGGIHPDLPGTAYFELAAQTKRSAPGLHLHAFSPMEVMNGVARTGLSIEDWLLRAKESGVDSLPGTAAEILDDDVRWILTKGKLPTAQWIEVVTTAHRLGIRTTSTMMYGHVDTPAHWVAHLRLLARLQGETGGFTEFVPLPFVHHNSPIYLAGVARPGPTEQENRAVHAMARLLLHGRIDNIQASWVKLGVDGVRQVLQGGVNDLGGTLMEETISRMAGSEHGSRKSVDELEAIPAGIGRPSRQRTTDYRQVMAERVAAARRRVATLPLA